MTDRATDRVLEIADDLYALPLGDFTPARDARAKELKGTDDAPRVKALRKPSLAAWVVNLLVRRESAQVEQVIAMGAALRQAQEGMSGDDLRALTRQRRQLTSAVTQQARSLASEEGVRVTSAVSDQVEATLTAAMVDERCGQAVRSGLLVAALATTGVDEVDLGAVVALPEALGHAAAPTVTEPVPTRPDLRVVPDPDAEARARAAAQEELDGAQAAVGDAQAAYDDTVAACEELQARALEVEARIDELKRQVAELEASYEEVDEELGEAENARMEAGAALHELTDERDRAAAALARLA